MKRITFPFFLLMLILFVSVSFCETHAKEHVRIAILNDATDFYISIVGKYKITDLKTNEVLDEGIKLNDTQVTVDRGFIRFGDNLYRKTHIKIFAKKYVSINQNKQDRQYRGDIDIFVTKNGRLLVVNTLELEKYVQGVLFHEVSHRWPIEAIKAQAVATRSYALYQAEVNKGQLYDVTSGIYSQVYGGKSAERYRTNIAVKRTEGEVLTYKGKILPAYFHANSGGHTEDAGELWKHNLAPLAGIADPYAQSAPSYWWKRNFRSEDVQAKLIKHGYTIGMIEDIVVLDRTKSGRVRKLRITDRAGKSINLSGKDFRQIVGPNLVRSNLYDVVMQGYYFDLIGRGWGHGVGMSQWSAQVMSRKRIKYHEILRFFYPGTKLVKLGQS